MRSLVFSFSLAAVVCSAGPAPAADYAVVVSRSTAADSDWKQVVEVLREKHQAAVIIYPDAVTNALPELQKLFPRYACFVATPAEAGRTFVAQVHRVTRAFDDDPYPDCFWGILTGYDASNALRIARCKEPLVIRRAAAGTQISLASCEAGVWHSEVEPGKHVRKTKDSEPEVLKGPRDSTEAIARLLTDYNAELFVTSGHATERDWQIGFAYRNGSFRCENGVLYGIDTANRKIPIESSNPKVYLAVGNCLMGHIDTTNAMALAFLNSAGVMQMAGYTVNTWYGYAGWGCLDYFVEQPGRFTLAEAFTANQVALLHRLQTYFPMAVSMPFDPMSRQQPRIAAGESARRAGLNSQDGLGLLYDRDVLAFYGDPAWIARMAPGSLAWTQELKEENGTWTLEVKPKLGERSFSPIDQNGSQRGGRPIVQFLPKRVAEAKVLEGAELNPVIADDFVFFPNPGTCDPSRTYRVRFQAKAIN